MPGSSARPLPRRDLDHILKHTDGLWEELRGGRLFVTGGTGFFGRWILESFLWANDSLALGADAVVLTRAPEAFAAAAPHIAGHAAVTTHRGDIRSFEFPRDGCTHVLHLATETTLEGSRLASFHTAVSGTSRVLEFAAASGARKFLLTSSGAVYGEQPPSLERISEEFSGAPDPTDAAAGYAHGKRAAEFLCSVAASESGMEVKIARCFAFVGPLIPLDANFAIGNFIRDCLERDAIEVAGDGSPRRSYLYAADLAIWLWTILFRGEVVRPYNVGSEDSLSIRELAELVGSLLRPGIPVRVANTPTRDSMPARYVPSTSRAATELDLQSSIDLSDAIRRTAEWYSTGPMHERAP